MPGPKTHDIFYKELKKSLADRTRDSFSHYDDYNLFAQGHDFLIYYDFYKIGVTNEQKLKENLDNSSLLQEYKIQEFIYNYLNNAKEGGVLEEEATRLFIGPGYMMHHLLDAYTHPQIIYYAGDHVREPQNKTWQHGIVENLIDIYMMKEYEGKDPAKYKVYKDFKINKENVSSGLIKTLDSSLEETYGMKNGGETFEKAFFQTETFMRTLKYDPTGLGRFVFDKADPKLKGTKAFSYNRDVTEVTPYLNLEHETWVNPMDETITSTASFLELFNKAIEDGSYIVDELEKICQSGIINRDDIYSLIPNISSTHGLESGQPIKILNKKKW